MKDFNKGYRSILILLPIGIVLGIAGGLISGFFINNWGVENSLTIGLIMTSGTAFYYTWHSNRTTVREMKKTRYADSIPIILIETPEAEELKATELHDDIKLTNVGKGIATNVSMRFNWNKKTVELSDINVNKSSVHKILVTEKEEIKNMPENSCRIEVKYRDIFANQFISWSYCIIVGQDDIKFSKWQYKPFIKD